MSLRKSGTMTAMAVSFDDMHYGSEADEHHQYSGHSGAILRARAFGVMASLQKNNQLCDVTLRAGEKSVCAHRIILASRSPYFFAMFTGDLFESKADTVTLKGVDGEALQILIDFMYSAEIEVTEENVQLLLPAANILQLQEVRDACCRFLQAQLHPSNCIGISVFADIHDCIDLRDQAKSYMDINFNDVVKCEEFLQLPTDQVIHIIKSDGLVTSEEQVFEAVTAWVSQEQSRDAFLPQLMEHVRLPLLSQEYLLETVGEDSRISSNPHCKDLLIEAMKYHLVKSEQRSKYRTARTRPRKPQGVHKLMLVVGGQAPKAIRHVECLDFEEETWSKLADMPERRCRAGIAVHDGMIYVVGGFNGNMRVRTVISYEPKRDMWRPVVPMDSRRSTLGAAVLNSRVYAVGGFDGSSGLNSVECLDIPRNEWITVASMTTRRSSVGVGVLDGHLYAVGGYDGASRQCLSSVERYNPDTDEWVDVAEMMSRRSGAGVGVLYGLLYAVGGHDGPVVRRSVEVYDPQRNLWTPTADMHVCRRNAGVAAVGGYLYVVGGEDGSTNLASVERYDPRSNVWHLMPQSMGIGRSYTCVCIVDKPYCRSALA